MKKRHGQAAIIGLFFSLVLVAAFAIMSQPLLQFIAIGVNQTQNATNGTLLALIFNSLPLFMALMVLVAVVIMIMGRER